MLSVTMDLYVLHRITTIFLITDFCTGQLINSIAPNTRVQTLYERNIQGGGLLGGNIPLERCDALCQSNPTCVGFDWVKDPPKANIKRCYRHSWTSICNPVVFVRGIIHVDYLICSIQPCVTGGTIIPVTTHDECLFRCRTNATCASAQFRNSRTFSVTSCIHFSIFESCSTTPDPSNQQCRHYRRSTCDVINRSVMQRILLSSTTEGPTTTPTTTTPTTTTPTTTITTTTTATTPTTSPTPQTLLGARSVLEKLENFHAQGGTLQRKIRDATTCVRTCSASRDCFALDFVTMDNSCWFHTATSGCAPLRSMNSSTHYQFVKCYRNRHIYGGTEIAIVVAPDGSSLAACINRCNSDIGCYGVDFNRRNNRCFHHSGVTVCNSKNLKYGCTHYQLQDAKCPDPASQSFGGTRTFLQQQSDTDTSHINIGVSIGSYIIRGPFEEPDKWVNIVDDGHNTTDSDNINDAASNVTTKQDVTTKQNVTTKQDVTAKQNDQINDLGQDAKTSNDLENTDSISTKVINTNTKGTITSDDIISDSTSTNSTSENNLQKDTNGLASKLESDLENGVEDHSDLDIGTVDIPDVISTLSLNEDHPDILVHYPGKEPIRFNRDGSLKLTGAFSQDTTTEQSVSIAIIKSIKKGDDATIVADHVIPGGIKQSQVFTFPGCIRACNNTKGCLAADYDFIAQECLFHSLTTVCSDLTMRDEVFHVRFAQCPMPVSQQAIYIDTNAPRGELQRGIKSYRKCYAGCQGDQKCQAVDFNFFGRACFYHDETTACQNLGRAPGVVHIKKKSC